MVEKEVYGGSVCCPVPDALSSSCLLQIVRVARQCTLVRGLYWAILIDVGAMHQVCAIATTVMIHEHTTDCS
jgi:hypothetical protein